jgi:Ala-tRNA(Pro) deacylase
LTFASDDDLEAVLGVKSGIVTPLALMHDNDISVTVLLDRQIEKMPKIGIHPNTNEATIFVTYADLLRILSLVNHEPIFID